MFGVENQEVLDITMASDEACDGKIEKAKFSYIQTDTVKYLDEHPFGSAGGDLAASSLEEYILMEITID